MFLYGLSLVRSFAYVLPFFLVLGLLFETGGGTLQLGDTPTRNLVLGPDRYVVLEVLPDLTRGATKATKRYFIADVC